MKKKAFENIYKRRYWNEFQLIEFWDNLIMENTESYKICFDIQMMVTDYICSLSYDQVEDECVYNDLPKYEE